MFEQAFGRPVDVAEEEADRALIEQESRGQRGLMPGSDSAISAASPRSRGSGSGFSTCPNRLAARRIFASS
jgi:hypothetical protein